MTRAFLSFGAVLALRINQSLSPVTYAAWTTISIDGKGADWSGLPSFTDPSTHAGGNPRDTAMERN